MPARELEFARDADDPLNPGKDLHHLVEGRREGNADHADDCVLFALGQVRIEAERSDPGDDVVHFLARSPWVHDDDHARSPR
jgi:hypothetical protein